MQKGQCPKAAVTCKEVMWVLATHGLLCSWGSSLGALSITEGKGLASSESQPGLSLIHQGVEKPSWSEHTHWVVKRASNTGPLAATCSKCLLGNRMNVPMEPQRRLLGLSLRNWEEGPGTEEHGGFLTLPMQWPAHPAVHRVFSEPAEAGRPAWRLPHTTARQCEVGSRKPALGPEPGAVLPGYLEGMLPLVHSRSRGRRKSKEPWKFKFSFLLSKFPDQARRSPVWAEVTVSRRSAPTCSGQPSPRLLGPGPPCPFLRLVPNALARALNGPFAATGTLAAVGKQWRIPEGGHPASLKSNVGRKRCSPGVAWAEGGSFQLVWSLVVNGENIAILSQGPLQTGSPSPRAHSWRSGLPPPSCPCPILCY